MRVARIGSNDSWSQQRRGTNKRPEPLLLPVERCLLSALRHNIVKNFSNSMEIFFRVCVFLMYFFRRQTLSSLPESQNGAAFNAYVSQIRSAGYHYLWFAIKIDKGNCRRQYYNVFAFRACLRGDLVRRKTDDFNLGRSNEKIPREELSMLLW